MRQVNGDWWPDRDQTCHRVAYQFKGADRAISHCKKTDLVIQAGGNVGAWPKHLRKSFARVITFEPSLENYELMLKNLSAGMDVEVWYAALGEKAGRCGIKKNPENCGDDQTIEGTEVGVVAIDDLLLDPDLLYLDIQGDEVPALKGAKLTLDRCTPVVAVEYDKNMIRRHGDPEEYLLSIGYRLVEQVSQDKIFVRD